MMRRSGVSTTSAWMLILRPAALVGEMRLQPADRQHRLLGRLRQDEAAAAGHLELDDLGDRDLADPPFHVFPSALAPRRRHRRSQPRGNCPVRLITGRRPATPGHRDGRARVARQVQLNGGTFSRLAVDRAAAAEQGHEPVDLGSPSPVPLPAPWW